MQEITEDYLTQRVLNNGTVLTHFPFLNKLRTLHHELRTCPVCQQSVKGAAFSREVQVAKRQLAKMPQKDKDLFKQLLGLSHARVFYPENVDGKYIRLRIDF